MSDDAPKPIDMVLFCPFCGVQHLDAPDDMKISGEVDAAHAPAWKNPSHRSHLCGNCGKVWRPADVPTHGVRFVQTCGAQDSEMPIRAAVFIAAGCSVK